MNYCEIDKYASKSYSAVHNVPESLNLGDITKIDTSELPHIDMICYGFPCQDISLAGKQKGLFNDDGSQTRSGLFFEALRIIEDTRPRVAIAENVKNLTSKKFKEQFAIVLNSLENAGYNNYWQVLNAKDYGVPQNRERVFIVSIRKDVDTGVFNFPEPFELKLRLKDLLETEVDEKYYLSKKLTDYLKPNDNKTIAEPQVKRIGNCCPTKNRDNPNQGRIYDTEGLSPALNCMGGDNRQPCIPVLNPLKDKTTNGWHFEQQVYDADGITRAIKAGGGSGNIPKVIERPAIPKTAKTICLNSKGGRNGIEGLQPSLKDRVYDSNGISAACTTSDFFMPSYTTPDMRIRKLTPLECWRLMGFDDEDFHRAEKVNSNTQLYKQAGNSIVVNVLEAIFVELGKIKIFN